MMKKTKCMNEGIKKIADRYIKKCPKCGTDFYPWETLMITYPKEEIKEFLYCPNCKHYGNIGEFLIS